MKKLILISLMALVLMFAPSLVSAQRAQQQGAAQNQATQGSQVQNQNQIQTQNQGVDTQLRVATQHMEQLMEMTRLGEETKGQVRTLAQGQIQDQTETQVQLDRLESRSSFMKKLFGPDLGAIESLRQQMAQNKSRLEQLQGLAIQTQNQADKTQLQEAAQALVDQNASLEAQIQTEEQAGSLLGWFFKLLNRFSLSFKSG